MSRSNKRSISHGFFARVFSILDRHRISVDHNLHEGEVHVSMAITRPTRRLAADKAVLEQRLLRTYRRPARHGHTSLVGADEEYDWHCRPHIFYLKV